MESIPGRRRRRGKLWLNKSFVMVGVCSIKLIYAGAVNLSLLINLSSCWLLFLQQSAASPHWLRPNPTLPQPHHTTPQPTASAILSHPRPIPRPGSAAAAAAAAKLTHLPKQPPPCSARLSTNQLYSACSFFVYHPVD